MGGGTAKGADLLIEISWELDEVWQIINALPFLLQQ
jgi:hypothetical protein